MVFFCHAQTGRNGSVQNNQPNQPTGPRIALFLYYRGRSTGESPVRLVWSVRSDRIKEQALRRRVLTENLNSVIVRQIIIMKQIIELVHINYVLCNQENLQIVRRQACQIFANEHGQRSSLLDSTRTHQFVFALQFCFDFCGDVGPTLGLV